MFHEVTYAEAAKRRRSRVIAGVIVLALAALLAVVGSAARANARAQGAAAMRESILNAAKQCAAIEGTYPAELSHLEDYYGLTINRDDYIVTYECFADNIVPSVVVAPR